MKIQTKNQQLTNHRKPVRGYLVQAIYDLDVETPRGLVGSRRTRNPSRGHARGSRRRASTRAFALIQSRRGRTSDTEVSHNRTQTQSRRGRGIGKRTSVAGRRRSRTRTQRDARAFLSTSNLTSSRTTKQDMLVKYSQTNSNRRKCVMGSINQE